MSADLQALSDYIASSLGETIENRAIAFDELTIVVRREDIVRAATFLRDDPQCRFVCFIDICGAD
jgi:NADH-quinone oxidoreductase subunit C